MSRKKRGCYSSSITWIENTVAATPETLLCSLSDTEVHFLQARENTANHEGKKPPPAPDTASSLLKPWQTHWLTHPHD